MPDVRKNSAEQEGSHISVDDDNELQFWMRELGVDEATLKDLVQRKAGSAARIKQEIREIRRRG